jgi:ribosomal protein S18 acetylase RimI-like enzyme
MTTTEGSGVHADLVIRDLDRTDLPAIRRILHDTGLFPPALVEPMAEPFLSGQAPHHWLVASQDDRLVGFAYAEPERMTEGTFNLLAIAVDPAHQGSGLGRALVAGLLKRLGRHRGRVLIAETSSLDAFDRTRSFYERLGFREEARIQDFYAEGDGKVVFWKHL